MPHLYQQRRQKDGKTVLAPQWSARIRYWNAERMKWMWRNVHLGVEDRAAALKVAAELERSSEEAKAGLMTLERAQNLVQTILRLSGLQIKLRSEALAKFGEKFIAERMAKARDASKAKYKAHWDRFKNWAGANLGLDIDRWTGSMLTDYYVNLCRELSERTANDHLATLRMLFDRAQKLEVIRTNPVLLVDKETNASVEKGTFTRAEVARIVRLMRSQGREDWALLTLLGWHLGHRIQDLLSLTADNFQHLPGVGWTVTFQPGKKKGKGGRTVVLPIPTYMGQFVDRKAKWRKGEEVRAANSFEDFTAIHGADNRNGRVSSDFAQWMTNAGVQTGTVHRGKRNVSLKSFHSFRHSMASRLSAAGVDSAVARLVTDHDSEQVRRRYVHAEVAALATALQRARQHGRTVTR